MADQLTADFIIVGAGTAGLTLADELSKNSSLQVLVLEAGEDCTGHTDLRDLANYTANLGSDRDWSFDSVPQVSLQSMHPECFARS